MHFRKILLTIILLFTNGATAEYAGWRTPSLIFGSEIIRFGVDNPPADTCDYFNRQFRFDATTEGVKNMLSILLAARLASKEIEIWYSPSSKPGTNHTNGCADTDIARVYHIGIR